MWTRDARRSSTLHSRCSPKGSGERHHAGSRREAGISAGAIYAYFAGKDELVQAVFEQISRRDQELLQAAASGIRSPAEALLNVGRVVTESLKSASVREETVSVLEEILAESRGPDGPHRRREAQGAHLARLETLVRQAQTAGGLDDT